jgi:hypothetical protein
MLLNHQRQVVKINNIRLPQCHSGMAWSEKKTLEPYGL